MPEGQLLYCPNCKSVHGRPTVLGKLLPTGEFLILRFHAANGTTVIHASQFTVNCMCGFSYLINGATIQGTVNMGTQNYAFAV